MLPRPSDVAGPQTSPPAPPAGVVKVFAAGSAGKRGAHAAASENCAETDASPASATEQLPVPVQAPVHPRNVPPGAGVAVSTTVVPWSNGAEHEPGQEMPLGVDATAPAPVSLTLSVCRTAPAPGL